MRNICSNAKSTNTYIEIEIEIEAQINIIDFSFKYYRSIALCLPGQEKTILWLSKANLW